MSLAEVLDDRDVLDDAGDGVRVLKISLKVLLKVSSRSNIRNQVKIAPVSYTHLTLPTNREV